MKNVLPKVDFNNTQLAFQARTDKKLKKDYWLFKMVDSPFLTWLGPKLINFSFAIGLPIKGLIRKTIFQLFCGGESLAETVETSKYLASFGVKTILDYSVEGERTEAGFDATCEEIGKTLVHGGKYDEVAFCACKLTGMARIALLEKVQAGKELTEAETAEFERIRQRVDSLSRLAAENNTPLFIDAEESWIQDVIDQLAEEMMEKYNQEKAVVYTTAQLYRHDRLEYIRGLIERSKTKGYVMGIKLVRGAYLEKETLRAKEYGYENPMQPNKEATDRDFNDSVRLCLEHVDRVATCVGTHNEKSSLLVTEILQQKNLPIDHPHVWTAQLLGMSDHISFNLAHSGYNAAKYLPYGPVKSVMPYLIRRAEENTSIQGQSSREVELLSREVKRRKKQA
jgi:proline dehydrogenase